MFDWKRRRKQLFQEFEAHIDIQTKENIEAGMPPEAARQAARKKFGNVLLAAEQSREIWGGLWLERMLQDLRYAVRSLSGAPAYTVALLCTLVLGLGSVTTMSAIVESILIRPVALPHSEQLVQMYSEDGPGGFNASQIALSYKAIEELQRNAHSFSSLTGYNTMARPVTASDGTSISVLTVATPEFFATFGVQAKLGRLIGPGDARAAVAVVTDEFWRERLHADPKAVGATIKVSGQDQTVIGVLPAGVHVPQGTGGQIVYLPVSINASGQDDFKLDSALAVARLKPGISPKQAREDAQNVFSHADRSNAEQGKRLAMRSYQDLVVSDLQRPLLTLLGGVGVLLLIACANAANLQIGRATSRMQEMTTRSALGASFGRLLQQLVTESILVSLLGATLGAALSYVAIQVLRNAYRMQYSRFDELSIHPIVLVSTGLLAILVGVLASIAPLFSIRRQTTAPVNSRNASRTSRLAGVLVAIQVALTCVLLVVSGLFVRTLRSLEHVNLGFDPRNVTTLILMPEQQNQDPERSREIETRLLQRFETLPGVQSVAMQTDIPFSNYNVVLNGTSEVSGRAYHEGDAANYSMVSSNFVRASGIRLLQGRDFVPQDAASPAMLILVNETFVKKYLVGQHPIGASVRFHRNPGETDADIPFSQPMTIIGVVENEIQGGDLGAPHQPMVYLDYMKLPGSSFLSAVFSMTAQYAIRSPLAPAVMASELRATVAKEAPSMVQMNLQPMEDAIAQSLDQRRLALRLVAGFGVIALLLSAVGIYGVLAYSVALRRRDIGIRMALGSTRGKAAGLIMRQAGIMTLIGLIPGIAGACATGYAVRSFLYGVKMFDPASIVVSGCLLVIVFLVAASLPALRAAQVDPVEMLRAE
ncbi:putative permease [Granulicella aggregans]|uniref:Putative permease n=1 Tax=Granulicella aggregans TaxID=474949 RepID=A0A7W7ZKW6_9BACT|nr:ADOP family duplicated permease [Granulicella aggregans]MBB5061603.1 putative permease [Granulicella aggregans]